ncbi:SET domain-containing protein 4 [Gaertneriomyces sp. JEL0708]|nr:SET domain-containing protein 4 [Gaertneriomyces sp. JEL0708]
MLRPSPATDNDNGCEGDLLTTFLAWLRHHHPGLPSSLIPHTFSSGRGVLTTEDVCANKCLLEIPAALLVTVRTGGVWREGVTEMGCLAGWLCASIRREDVHQTADSLSESEKAASVDFGPYIDMLPQRSDQQKGEMDLPAMWSDDEIALLPDEIQRKVCEQRRNVVKDYVAYMGLCGTCQGRVVDEVGKTTSDSGSAAEVDFGCVDTVRLGGYPPKDLPLCEKCPRHGNDGKEDVKTAKNVENTPSISFAEYEWAYFLVNTRCVSLWTSAPFSTVSPRNHHFATPSMTSSFPKARSKTPSQLAPVPTIALVPFLDLLNHHPCSQTTAGFSPATNTFKLVTQTPVVAGSEVFINYGPHDAFFLLAEYGFWIKTKWDYVSVDHECWGMSLEDETGEEKKRSWEICRNRNAESDYVVQVGDVSERLKFAIRVRVLRMAKRKSDALEYEYDQCWMELEPELERRVVAFVKVVCTDKMRFIKGRLKDVETMREGHRKNVVRGLWQRCDEIVSGALQALEEEPLEGP